MEGRHPVAPPPSGALTPADSRVAASPRYEEESGESTLAHAISSAVDEVGLRWRAMEPYPLVEPFAHGLLEVGDDNLVYWETSGNPAARPRW